MSEQDEQQKDSVFVKDKSITFRARCGDRVRIAKNKIVVTPKDGKEQTIEGKELRKMLLMRLFPIVIVLGILWYIYNVAMG